MGAAEVLADADRGRPAVVAADRVDGLGERALQVDLGRRAGVRAGVGTRRPGRSGSPSWPVAAAGSASGSPSDSRRMNWSQAFCRDAGVFVAAEAVDDLAGLAQPQRQAGEVAVAGDERERLDVAGVEQVHRVDDQRRVGGVLAAGEGVLVHAADGAGVELVAPAAQVRGRPVAVGALDRRVAELRDLVEQRLGVAVRGVVGVDQHGDPVGAHVGVHTAAA